MSQYGTMMAPLGIPNTTPLASGSGNANGTSRMKESSRSSRRRMGSNGPAVTLGGGAGAGAMSGRMPVESTATTRALEPLSLAPYKPGQPYARPPQPSSPLYAQHSPAMPPPRSPVFSVPVMSSDANLPMDPERTRGRAVMSSRSRSPAPSSVLMGTSSNSLSTTASTSSRTLKTPHSSKTDHHPMIASASGTLLESSPTVSTSGPQRVNSNALYSSPTPKTRPSMAMTAVPLESRPPVPSRLAPDSRCLQESAASERDINFSRPRAGPSTWVDGTALPKSPSPPRLPQAQMVPVRKDSPPTRPSFERASTAPTFSPSPESQSRTRKSADQLRSSSPTPAPKKAPRGTRSEGRLNGVSPSSTSQPPRWPSVPERPPILLRHSEDMLRTSAKHQKSVQKEAGTIQQRGVSAVTASGDQGAEKKPTTGLTLKKSSGALKALFNRGAGSKGKDKDRSEVPPVPSRKSGDELRRPSVTVSRRASPGLPVNDASPINPGRSSFAAERSLYPSAPAMMRATSAGRATTSMQKEAPDSEQRIASAESPLDAAPPSINHSGLADVPPSSSLPYLNAASNRVSLAAPVELQSASTENLNGISPSSSGSTTKASPVQFSPIKPSKSLHLLSLPDLDLDFGDLALGRFGTESPTTPRRSPRKSPRSPRSPYKATTEVSPIRSFSARSPRAVAPLRLSSDRIKADRRRSRSFDGPLKDEAVLQDFWGAAASVEAPSSKFISPSVADFFAAASSTSLFQATSSPELELSTFALADEATQLESQSESSHLSSDHARTPSEASSINEPASPTLPCTPSTAQLTLTGLETSETPSTEGAGFVAHNSKSFGLTDAPTIPLPAVPEMALAPPAVIEGPKLEDKAPPTPQRVHSLLSRSVVVMPESGLTLDMLTCDIERLLNAFRYPGGSVNPADRAAMLRNDLMSMMAEVDRKAYSPEDEQAYNILRSVCFEWAEALLSELRIEQPAHERGAALEGLAAVIECSALSDIALQASPVHQARFTQLMIKCMTFVMNKLGAKGVFHNTLLFSGRFLAFAFFRIPHIGEQLVTVLQPPKGALMRFTRGVMMGAGECPIKVDYPSHLLPLCFDNSKAYNSRLATLTAEFPSEEERDAFLFQPGNWLRRWQSDDSELFPAFYRAYHRQLAKYLGPVVRHYESLGRPVPASVLMRVPGYAHLATIFANKCHSYILGSVNAVTTSSTASNFDATESAGFRNSQKPPVLETANRRLVETISTFANFRVIIPDHQAGRMIEVDGTHLWTDMINVWTKNLISKTSLYAPKGVFSLFDLLDGIVDPPYQIIDGPVPKYSLLDVPHLIHVIRLILTEGEHALTLVKTIAFVFTHWEVLTARAEDRKELCLDLLLQKGLFERLLLFWSQSVRSYVLRLVVFRLGHLHTGKDDGTAHHVEIESVRLLQRRLETIKKRHDQLEPKPFALDENREDIMPVTPISENGDSFSMPRSRSTITMVADSPTPNPAAAADKAERLLGLGLGMDGSSKTPVEVEPSVKASASGSGIGKATNWLKKSFGNKKKRKDTSGASPLMGTPGSEESSPSSSPQMALKPLPGILKTSPNPNTASPLIDSPVSAEWSGESDSPTESDKVINGPALTRKTKPPPTIITTSPSTPKAGGDGFAFEFELPTMSPRSDTFDPTPASLPVSPNVKASRASQPPSPGQPPSPQPHMSRSFSKRSSLLPANTASVLESISEAERRDNSIKRRQRKIVEKEEEGYDAKLHAYAVRMLAELEDAQKEYDEWWSEDGVGKRDGAPPRLTVAWPFHDGED
ncbi:hypothetical protein IAU60_002744 [Kwoniella sp. DSM 27419]